VNVDNVATREHLSNKNENSIPSPSTLHRSSTNVLHFSGSKRNNYNDQDFIIIENNSINNLNTKLRDMVIA